MLFQQVTFCVCRVIFFGPPCVMSCMSFSHVLVICNVSWLLTDRDAQSCSKFGVGPCAKIPKRSPSCLQACRQPVARGQCPKVKVCPPILVSADGFLCFIFPQNLHFGWGIQCSPRPGPPIRLVVLTNYLKVCAYESWTKLCCKPAIVQSLNYNDKTHALGFVFMSGN